MATSTWTTQKFSAQAEEARKAADEGPVVIVEGERPASVLLNFPAYQRLVETARQSFSTGGAASVLSVEKSLLDVFDHPSLDDLPESFDFPRIEILLRPMDLP